MIDNKAIRKRNLQLLVEEVGSIAVLARMADTVPSYLSQALSLKTDARIGDKLARKLEAAMRKAHGWMDAMHEAVVSHTVADEEQEYALVAPPARTIPILEWTDIEPWLNGSLTHAQSYAEIVSAPHAVKLSHKTFVTRIEGDDMISSFQLSDSYCPGDMALVDPYLLPQVGDAVFVKIKDRIKLRQYLDDDGGFILKALNTQYSIFKFTDDIKLLGVVIITYKHRLKKRDYRKSSSQ